MKKWEYRHVTLKLTEDPDFNWLGKDGWELCVSYSTNQENRVFIFKRSIIQIL